MSDISNVLRKVIELDISLGLDGTQEALDEITRLTAELERLKRQVAEWVDAGGEAHSVIERQMEDRAKLRAAIECALRQLADGNRVLATGTLAAALSGDKQ